MTRLRTLINEVLSTPPKKKDCGCGCNTCEGKSPVLTEGKVKKIISEDFQYHVDNKIPLHESVYRIGSKKHLALINEARILWTRGLIDVSKDDQAILETHLGHFGLYEGVEVPLDLPMLNEDHPLFNQTNLSPKEYQKAKTLKGWDEKKDDYTWNPDKDLWTKEKKSKFKKHGEMSGFDMRGINEEELNEDHPLFNQTNLSPEEHQKAKTLKDWDKRKDDYTWNPDTGLWTKEKKSSLEERINTILEAKKKKKKEKKDPPLNKPKRGGSKAYYVYVRDPKTKKIKKVSFGSGGLRAKIKNKQARNAFAARHKCSTKKDRTTAGYWSCNLPKFSSLLGLGANQNTYW